MRTRPACRILILGGYGNTGRPLARLLLQHTQPEDITLVLAGRTVSRAEQFARELNEEFKGEERVTSRFVDASDPDVLLEAFEEVDLVVVASSTSAFVKEVATAALQAGIDYYDIQFTSYKNATLQAMAPDIEKAGLCFITDGGFHPGLPAALVRYVAPSFERLESAHVGSVINMDWKSIESVSLATMEEFAGEFVEIEMSEYKDGTWKDVGFQGMMNPREIDFGETFGKKYCFPMLLEEMKAIPTLYPDVSETGFYIAGLNWVVDWFITPIVMLGIKLSPTPWMKRTMGRFLYWGMRTFTKPPFGTLLKVEAHGIDKKDGTSRIVKEVMVQHQDGYLMTAIPVAATLLQYLGDEKESIRKPGLWFQANLVDPERLMADMYRMGIEIQPPLL